MMMNSKFEFGDQDGDGDSGEADCNNGQLLRDIEEISKALYLNNTPSKGSFSSSSSSLHNQPKSAVKTLVSKPKDHLAPRFLREDLFHKDKKLSLAWNWKKPLKALTHIGHQKFNCCFNLHVHSIQGLPSNFNGINLCVHWKRKSNSLQTPPSRVFLGSAEYDEILTHKCSVYGSRIGTSHSVKYDSKRFLIYASIVGAPEHDIGHHLVDLTRLLPLTLEELRGDKSSGKWTTGFRLAGKAIGAILNVSFSYQVLKDELIEFGGNNPNVLNRINLDPGRPSTTDSSVDFSPGNRDIKLWQAGSFARELHDRSVLPSHSVDVKLSNEVLLNSGSSLSKSISLLYQKLDEGNFSKSAARVDSKHLEPIKSQFSQQSNEHEFDGIDSDDSEFFIIEQGVETSEGDSSELDYARTQTIDVSIVEIINVDEIINDDEECLDKNTRCDSMDNVCDSSLDEEMMDDRKLKCSGSCAGNTDPETISESVASDNLDPLWLKNQFLDHEHYMSVKSNYKAHKTAKKSHSLDDITESVATDFLNMLALESGSFDSSCGDDPQSPREQLLRLFEKEALASGDFGLDFDANEEELGTDTLGLNRRVCAEDSDLSLIIQAVEEEHERASQSLMYRRQAKLLEDLETDSLMQQWGLNEKDFENSPEKLSGGFGSPIELPNEESSILPAIGQGLGSFVRTKDGGFLRSMNPLLFRNAKNSGKLIVQASNPIVLPPKMGTDILEILLHVSSDGVEELSNHTHKLMPLQDITGKSIEHIVWDATFKDGFLGRQGLWQQDLFEEWQQDLFEEFPYGFVTDECIGLDSDSVSLEAIAPTATCKIEALLIEGLRIQSGKSTMEAPSYIHPHYANIRTSSKGFTTLEGAAKLQAEDIGEIGNDVDGLIGLSMTLDKWLRLDSGIIEGDQNLDQVLEILKAYNSKISELNDEGLNKAMDRAEQYGRKQGLLANDLTVAFVIQLRDPLRNYEPVGVPMMVLAQVERVHIHAMQQDLDSFIEIQEQEMENDDAMLNDVENSTPQFLFRINRIHLAGVNTKAQNTRLWGTANQRQSGFRWLRAAGMDSTAKHYSSSNSRAIVPSSPMLTKKLLNEDILWSFSYADNNIRTNGNENVHIRNPDIIFPN